MVLIEVGNTTLARRGIKSLPIKLAAFFPSGNSKVPAAGAAKLLQSCPTLRDPIDGSPPGSPSLGLSGHLRLLLPVKHW